MLSMEDGLEQGLERRKEAFHFSPAAAPFPKPVLWENISLQDGRGTVRPSP